MPWKILQPYTLNNTHGAAWAQTHKWLKCHDYRWIFFDFILIFWPHHFGLFPMHSHTHTQWTYTYIRLLHTHENTDTQRLTVQVSKVCVAVGSALSCWEGRLQGPPAWWWWTSYTSCYCSVMLQRHSNTCQSVAITTPQPAYSGSTLYF